MLHKNMRRGAVIRRHARLRKNISGTAQRPRLNVFRSLQNIYVQVIDDEAQTTLVSANSLDKEIRKNMPMAAMRKQQPKWVNSSLREHLPRELTLSYLTEADTFITDASKHWLKELVKAA